MKLLGKQAPNRLFLGVNSRKEQPQSRHRVVVCDGPDYEVVRLFRLYPSTIFTHKSQPLGRWAVKGADEQAIKLILVKLINGDNRRALSSTPGDQLSPARRLVKTAGNVKSRTESTRRSERKSRGFSTGTLLP